MNTLRKAVEEAAFWEGLFCLSCDTPVEEPEGPECPECGRPTLVSAKSLASWLSRVEDGDD